MVTLCLAVDRNYQFNNTFHLMQVFFPRGGNLRLREVKTLAQGHTASWWQSWDSNPGPVVTEPEKGPEPHCNKVE